MQKVFWTQGAKVSEKSLAPVQPHFAPVQKQFWVVQKTFRRPLLPGSKRPFAPSPKHFWEFSLFGQFPRPAASQLWTENQGAPKTRNPTTTDLRWPGDSQPESGRFARIDSRESIRRKKKKAIFITHSLRIYPYPMVWPLPRPWSETMVSIPL